MSEENIEPVVKTPTVDTEWHVGEVNPKERAVALKHIRNMREKGMPKDMYGYDLGVTITLNGRHVGHSGVTFAVSGNGNPSRKELTNMALVALHETYGKLSVPDFTEQEAYALFKRDEV